MNAPPFLSTFQLKPFPEETLARFRSGSDDWGQPVTRIARAQGGEPLRDQLRRARTGEPILLGAFSPFPRHNPYREMGPVFVSAELPLAEVPSLADGFDLNGYFRATTALRAYDSQQRIHAATLVAVDGIFAQAARYFDDPAVSFVDARFAAYGCFACRFVRTENQENAS